MAELKKDAIIFSGGKSVKLPGGIVSISRTLELKDYYSRDILFYDPEHKKNKDVLPVGNIYALKKDELIEIADCMIQLWMELKDNVRRNGIDSADIFNVRQTNG